MDGKELEYVGGGVTKIYPMDIDKVSRFETLGLAKDIEIANVEEFYYLIPGGSLKDGLSTCHSDIDSLDMALMARLDRELVV